MTKFPPPAPNGYWAANKTIVITWPPNMPGVFASARWQQHADGSLSVEYTREELELCVGGMLDLIDQATVEGQGAPVGNKNAAKRETGATRDNA